MEWRYAEARAKRLAAEAEREAAGEEIERARVARAESLAVSQTRDAVLCGLAWEAASERKLAEKQAKVADCLRVEREIESLLTAMRVKTKQWEKLQENAALVDEEEDLRVLQHSWDEHGIRSHVSEAAGAARLVDVAEIKS